MLRGARMRAPDDKHAETNQRYAGPTNRSNCFVKYEMSEQRDHQAGDRRGRQHIAVVRPRKHQKVSDEKGQQQTDAQPDRSRGESAEEKPENIGGGPTGHRGNALHALTEKHVPDRSDRNHDQDQREGFKVEALLRRHASCDSPSPERGFIGGTATIAFCSTPLRCRETLRRSARSFMKSTASW